MSNPEFWFNTKLTPCLYCGGGRGETVSQHFSECPLRWHHESVECVTLRLNAYQAANLLKFLKLACANKVACPNSGDWLWEVPYQLEAMMKKKGWKDLRTNGGGEDPYSDFSSS